MPRDQAAGAPLLDELVVVAGFVSPPLDGLLPEVLSPPVLESVLGFASSFAAPEEALAFFLAARLSVA